MAEKQATQDKAKPTVRTIRKGYARQDASAVSESARLRLFNATSLK